MDSCDLFPSSRRTTEGRAAEGRARGFFTLSLLARALVGCGLFGALLSACASGPRTPRDLSGTRPILRTLDGSDVDVQSLIGEHEATLFVFFGASCPCVRRYQARIEALERTFAPKGVAFIAVDSNSDDSPATLDRTIQERRMTTRMLKDPDARFANLLGARTTPTVALVDRSGRVRYFGWIDNERQPGESGRLAYAEDALHGVLEKRPFVERTSVFGCLITRSLSGTTPNERREDAPRSEDSAPPPSPPLKASESEPCGRVPKTCSCSCNQPDNAKDKHSENESDNPLSDQSKGHSGDASDDRSGDGSDDRSGDGSEDHSGEAMDDHSREAMDDHSGDGSDDHSEKQPGNHSGKGK